MQTFEVVLALLGIVVVSVLIGAYVAKAVRWPEAAWKVGLVLMSVGVSVLILICGWPPKQGIDLKGGVILMYEVDEAQSRQVASRSAESKSGTDAAPAADANGAAGAVDMPGLIQALARRINPTGVEEIVVRKSGEKQVEVIIPNVSTQEIQRIKSRITTGGFLEFLIVANARDHSDIWSLADDTKQQGLYEVRDGGGRVVGRWVKLAFDGPQEPGKQPTYRIDPPGAKSRIVRGRKEVLMVVDPDLALQGSHLTNIRKGYQDISPAVFFETTYTGARLMGQLTATNLPDTTANHYAHLGIVMDNELLNAPRINSTITSSGVIEGYSSEQEVDDLVNVLRAGRLPAVLREEPISEDAMSPLLGTDMIRQGQTAIVVSLVVVVLFMLVYYHFCGLIACIALVLNLIMTLALMIFIGAAFSLPGMAGMVLTVGMSVDANVLVFERIREELRNGAAVRMAIRNGFSRATTTIIDSNLTTLITAIVLYAVGNEQLKSFAVTLTLGILMCIYTAVFVSWLLFDLTDRFVRIKRLSMLEIIKELNIDYYRLLIPATSLSLVFILVGLVGVVIRGERIFDIDFTGGISVRMLLKEPTPIAEVRKIAANLKTDGLTEDVSVTEMASTEHGPGRIYRIDTSLPTNADMANATSSGIRQTKEALTKYFRDEKGNLRLQTHSVQFTPPTPVTAAAEPTSNGASSAPAAAGAGQAEVSAPSDVEGAKPAAESAPAEAPAGPSPNQGSSHTGTDKGTVVEALPNDNVLAYAGPVEVAQATGTPAAEPPATEPATANDDNSAAASSSPAGSFSLGSNAVDASRLQSETQLTFDEKINAETIESMVKEVARGLSLSEPDVVLSNPKWDGTGSQGYNDWKLQLSSSVEESSRLLSKLQEQLNSTPIWLSANQIGSSVAGNKTKMAFIAVFASLLALIIYIWVRFERLVYGVAAVIALLHDVLVTLGAIALSYWLKDYLGILMIEEFKISLPVLAAILTIIGYSLNDTIVIFDRIREVKGKSPYLTSGMINKSINQTMSRTILTALTVFISVIVLYIFGGQGIHAFAFAMLVGVIAGSYSSIYIAAPILLWLRPPAENRVAVRGGSVAV